MPPWHRTCIMTRPSCSGCFFMPFHFYIIAVSTRWQKGQRQNATCWKAVDRDVCWSHIPSEYGIRIICYVQYHLLFHVNVMLFNWACKPYHLCSCMKGKLIGDSFCSAPQGWNWTSPRDLRCFHTVWLKAAIHGCFVIYDNSGTKVVGLH